MSDEVVLISAGVGTLELCTATNTWTAVGSLSLPFSSLTSGVNTTAAMQAGTGSSVSPLNLGQVFANNSWMQSGISAPALSTSTSGGTIASGHSIHVVVTYNSAAGETLPSVEATISTAGGGGTNSVTVTAPSLPSGYIGYTVYDFDVGAGGTYPNWKQQTASAACVNITTNCVIGTIATGSVAPTVNSAWLQPPNNQAFNGIPGEIPTVYFPKADGNNYPWITIDWSTCGVNFNPCGTPTFTHRTFFTDFGNGFNTSPAWGSFISGQSYNNALVSINHLAGVGTSTTNQDRALGILMTNAPDANNHYALEGIQVETDFRGSGSINGSPDGEAAAGSFQMDYLNTANGGCGTLGCNAIRANVFRDATAVGFPGGGLTAVWARAQNDVTVNGSSGTMVALHGECNTGVVGVGIFCTALDLNNGGGGSWAAGGLVGAYIHPFTCSNCFNLISQGVNATPSSDPNWFGGNVFLPAILSSGGTIPIAGSITSQAFQTVQLTASPGSPTITNSGTPGATTYTYKIIPKDTAGGTGVLSSGGTTATGNNVLTGGNFNVITVFATGNPQGTSTFDVYRTACGGAGICGTNPTGKIGSVTVTSTGGASNSNSYGTTLSFNDTGLSGDGSTAPSVNTTGEILGASTILATNNTVRVANDVTFNADTALHTITGLTWNLDTSARNYSFHCWLQYSQATAGAANNIGIQSATVAATNIAANGTAQLSLAAGVATFSAGPGVTTLSSTTATNVITFTPAATATVFTITMDGTIEQPASGGGNVINIMASTGAAADALTIKRGGYCSINP